MKEKFMKWMEKPLHRNLVIVVVILLIMSVGYSFGSSVTKTEIEGKKTTYDELTQIIMDLENEIKEKEQDVVNLHEEIENIEKQLETEQNKLKNKQEEVENAFALLKETDDLKAEVEDLKKEIDSHNKELETITADIEDKENELKSLEETITKKKEEPIELTAGEYIVGIDIPVGRYQTTNVGSGSNFVVYSAAGSLKVNTILGDDLIGYGDYVFFAEDGDIIESAARVKLIPVE